MLVQLDACKKEIWQFYTGIEYADPRGSDHRADRGKRSR